MSITRNYSHLHFLALIIFVSLSLALALDESEIRNPMSKLQSSYGITRRLSRAVTPSPKKVFINVDGFGAKADGTDDSQVNNYTIKIKIIN